MSDVADDVGLYFRQLLSGRDFARGDQMARQMVNFVYLIGDRETGDAIAVDPAYGPAELVDLLAAEHHAAEGAEDGRALADEAVEQRVCHEEDRDAGAPELGLEGLG